MPSALETIGPDARLVLIAANPRSGARSSRPRVEALVAELKRQRLAARVIGDLDEVAEAAREALQSGELRALVAAGGDGTLAELVNRTPADTPLSVFPLGTANLMARYLGVAPRAGPFAAMLAAGAAVRLDAARGHAAPATRFSAGKPVVTSTAEPGGRVFLIMAGIGFDAAVVDDLHSRRSGHIRMWNYAKPIWDCLRNYSYPRLVCECACAESGETVATRRLAFDARWLFVQNLPCYAGGLQFAPLANARDGLLDVCALEKGSRWHGLRYLSYVLRGAHRRLPDCRMLRVAKLRVEADAPALVQFDGDPGGQLPLEIEVLPGRARMVAPEATIRRIAVGE